MSDIKNLTNSNETYTTISTDPNGSVKNITTIYNGIVPNNAPNIQDIVITMLWNTTYNFTLSEIDAVYSDIDGNNYANFKIVSTPLLGLAKLNGIPVVVGQIFSVSDINNFSYTPAPNGFGLEYATIIASINDDGVAPNIYSNNFNIVFNVNSITPPFVNNRSVCIVENTSYIFSIADFTVDYQDNQNGVPYDIRIETIPSGALTLNGIAVVVGQRINVTDLGGLVFTPLSNQYGRPYTQFSFSISDNLEPNMFSLPKVVSVTVNAIPTILSSTPIQVNVNGTYTFTQTYFQSRFQDDDGDLCDFVQILSLPTSGTLTLNGVDIVVNQVIALSDLSTNLMLFTPNVMEDQSLSFSFRLRDNFNCINAWSLSGIVFIETTTINEPPVVGSFSIQICPNSYYEFNWSEFASTFSDLEGSELQSIRFETLPTYGILMYNGIPITVGQQFDYTLFNNPLIDNVLAYQSPDVPYDGQTYFALWSGLDGDGSWSSNQGTVNLVVNSSSECYYNTPSNIIGNWI